MLEATNPVLQFWHDDHETSRRPVFTELETGDTCTPEHLKKLVLDFARHLAGMGVSPGVRVILHLHNSIDAIVAQMAIHYLGAVVCFVDGLVQPQSLGHYLRVTEGKVLVTHADMAQVDQDALASVRVIRAQEVKALANTPSGVSIPPEPYTFHRDEPTFIYFTSGTTSLPKGVVLSIGNFANFVRICDRYWQPVDESSRHLAFVPFSHGFGTMFLVPLALRTHSQLFILRAFHPQRVLDAIVQRGITHLYGVPSHYSQLLRMGSPGVDALNSLRMAFCAAAKLEHSLMLEWERRTGIVLCEGYGLIETCCGITWRVGDPSQGTGHMGPLPDRDLIELGILDENDELVQPGTIGQIAVRGPSVMQGYLNDPEATNRVMVQGWFKTGDQGYISADNQLFLTGRIKDIINIAGIKVSPFEVEAVLDAHPAVLQSVVVPAQDALYGEVVKAFVRLRPGHDVTERELIKFAAQKLINFQVPKRIEFTDVFPLNTMGKIDRKQLRKA